MADQQTAQVGDKLKNVVENRLTEVGQVPANTSASNLAMLKLISQVSEMKYGNDEDSAALKAIAEKELRYLKRAVVALNEDEKLRTIYGGGLAGATSVAQLLQEYDKSLSAQEALKKYLPEYNKRVDGEDGTSQAAVVAMGAPAQQPA